MIVDNIADKAKGYTWIKLSDGKIVNLNVNPADVDKSDTTDTERDGVPDVKELTGKIEKEFNYKALLKYLVYSLGLFYFLIIKI